jgi:glycosyltransferase involved in cell wall biosynthesis
MHHDFIVFHDESIQGKVKAFRRGWYTRKNLLAANGVQGSLHIANSSHTREEAFKFFPQYRDTDFKVLPLGVRFSMGEPRTPALPTQDQPLELLYVGAYEARKNVVALITALPKLHPSRPLHLTLVGKMSASQADALKKVISTLPNRCCVSLLGRVDDASLKDAYVRAHFFVSASLFEGYGLPLVEAMALGLPVLAFRNSAISEMVADAGVLTENGDFEGWGQQIQKALENPSEYRRWSQAGWERSQAYSEQTMLGQYRKAMQGFLGLGEIE